MEVPRHWRLQKQRYSLVGEACPHCEGKIFSPRDICPHCGNDTRTERVNSPQQAYAISGMVLAPEVKTHSVAR